MEPICFVDGGKPAGVPERPFLTNPTSCSGPVQALIRVRSWTGETDGAGFTSHDQFGNPIGVAGCDDVPFSPTFKATASEPNAASPGGMRFEIGLPQSEAPSGLATSHLKGARVVLPAGVTVQPGSADGLAACTPAQIDLDGAGPAACPDASKVGSVRLDTHCSMLRSRERSTWPASATTLSARCWRSTSSPKAAALSSRSRAGSRPTRSRAS